MDFGDVLDEWEKIKHEHKASVPSPEAKKPETKTAVVKKTATKKPATQVLEEWLSANVVSDKDDGSDECSTSTERGLESRRLAVLKAQAVLDLHGMTSVEAEVAIADFLGSASRSGLEKVLVIHGKGLHSAGAPVLKKAARRILESHPCAGCFGEASKADGGSGALWVLIKGKRHGTVN